MALLGPMMLANVIQSLSGAIGAIFLGRMLGVGALAAAASFFPVILFFMAFNIGLGSGAAVLIGQACGARKPETMKAVAGTALAMGLVAGAVIAVLGGIFAEAVVRFLGTPHDIIAPATQYARVMMIGMPLMMVFILGSSMLRGVGDTMTPLWMMVVSTLATLVFTPVLIGGWGPVPALGVAGAPIAGYMAYVVALMWLFVVLRRKKHALAPDGELLRHMRLDPKLTRAILKIGLPTAAQMVVLSLAELAILTMVNRFGSDATAAYGAVNQVMGYVQFPVMSIAIAASILAAQAIGRGDQGQLRAIVRTGQMLNLAITGGLIALAYLLAKPILSLFLTDPKVVHMARELAFIVLWSMIVFGAGSILSAVMRSSGVVWPPMLISALAILGVEVPLAWVLSGMVGLDGVWIAYPAAFVVMAAGQALYYRYVWKKKQIVALV